MSESKLRWRARIGALKSVAGFVAFLAGLMLLATAAGLPAALRAPAEPPDVALGRVVRGEIPAGQYVRLSGLAEYDEGYYETDRNDKITTTYYMLSDYETGDIVLVKSPKPLTEYPPADLVKVSGILRPMPSDLQEFMADDLSELREVGWALASKLYLEENQKPARASDIIRGIAILGFILLLCAVPLLFPSTVFSPQPTAPYLAPESGEPGVKATGRFLRLKSVEPVAEVGKGARSFREAVANIVPQDERRLLVHIHYVLNIRSGLLRVATQTSDWAVFLEPQNVMDVTPGKLYGWKDRWAVRVNYHDEKQKARALIVSFNHAGAQSDFVDLLRKMGFTMGTEHLTAGYAY